MTMRYSHLSDAYLRKTVNAMQLGNQPGVAAATTSSRAG
jgi:hypothetical protein